MSRSGYQLVTNHPLGDLVVFVNGKSGGQQGKTLIEKIKQLVPEHQIYDVGNGGPEPGLNTWRGKGKPFRVLVCGGDGSIGWVLGTLDKLEFKEAEWPPMAILPLGTGNDVSRTLEWGPGYENESLSPILEQVDSGELIRMDRWFCDMKPFSCEDTGAPKNLIMNAYFGMGVDAEVALMFHEMREANPSMFKNRTTNKGIYTTLGVKAMVKGHDSLNQILNVELDGQPFQLPKKLQGFLVLNLPSWGGGKDPWGTTKKGKFRDPCIDDRKVEVVGFSGVMHMGLIQSGMGKGKRLAQASTVKIINTKAIPVQVDGEPWLMPPTETVITHHGQASMLFNAKNSRARAKMTKMVTNIYTSAGGQAAGVSPAVVAVKSNTLQTRASQDVPDTFDPWNSSMRPGRKPKVGGSDKDAHKREEIGVLLGHTKFTEEQLGAIWDKFVARCPNEQMTRDQYVPGMCENGVHLYDSPASAVLVDRLLEMFDQDGNGAVSYQEFVMGLSVLLTGSFEEKLRFGFVLFDINGDAGITAPEMQTMLRAVMTTLATDPEPVDAAVKVFVNLIFAQYDADKDGYISFEEFVRAAEWDPRFAYLFTLGTAKRIY